MTGDVDLGAVALQHCARGAPLLCSRVATFPKEKVIPGSTQDKCAFCDDAVWVSPTSVPFISLLGLRPTCFPCVLKMGSA